MIARMSALRITLPILVALAMLACGPPQAGLGPSDDESGNSGTQESTSTDGETSTQATTDTTDDPPTFLPNQDEDMWTKYACDSVLQDCPAGEKCVPYGSSGGSWDALKCVPVMGDQAPGEPCTWNGIIEGTDDCDETSACWDVMDVDGELIGTCFAFCSGNPRDPECSAGSECGYLGQSSIAFCFSQCDPLAQDCGNGLGCFWANGAFQCVFTTQDIPAGEPCGFINDCAAGLGCVTAELFPACAGAACCSPFCDINVGDLQCESLPGTNCVSFFEEGMALPGYEDVGVCTVN